MSLLHSAEEKWIINDPGLPTLLWRLLVFILLTLMIQRWTADSSRPCCCEHNALKLRESLFVHLILKTHMFSFLSDIFLFSCITSEITSSTDPMLSRILFSDFFSCFTTLVERVENFVSTPDEWASNFFSPEQIFVLVGQEKNNVATFTGIMKTIVHFNSL